MMDISEARQLKDLQKENTELKKMLAESLLKNRVLEGICENFTQLASLSHFAAGAFDVSVSWASPNAERRTVEEAALGTVNRASAPLISKDCSVAAPRRVARG